MAKEDKDFQSTEKSSTAEPEAVREEEIVLDHLHGQGGRFKAIGGGQVVRLPE